MSEFDRPVADVSNARLLSASLTICNRFGHALSVCHHSDEDWAEHSFAPDAGVKSDASKNTARRANCSERPAQREAISAQRDAPCRGNWFSR